MLLPHSPALSFTAASPGDNASDLSTCRSWLRDGGNAHLWDAFYEITPQGPANGCKIVQQAVEQI